MTHNERLKEAGVGVASITQWCQGVNPDVTATRKHIEWLVTQGAEMVVVGGTTGDGHCMSLETKLVLYGYVASNLASRCKVALVAGTGTTDRRMAREIARCAATYRFDGVLALPNCKDPQLLHELATCLENTGDNPPGLIVYVIPQLNPIHTATPQEIAELRLRHPGLYIAVKDSRGSLHGLLEWYRQDPFMDVWIGDDLIVAPGFYALCCLGLYPKQLRVISGSANLPRALVELLNMAAAAKRADCPDYGAMLAAQGGLNEIVYGLLEDAHDSFAGAVKRALKKA
jgi:dihydrodipicolinate synthase/N-acetylneuraminate lyase